jgi:hypothetical protein
MNALRSDNVISFPRSAPEHLVGVGFRCWLGGLSSGDIQRWEEAWNTFSGALGPDRAKDLLLDLSHFVRAVKANAHRDIQISPTGAGCFCRDECLAISIIAATQHGDRSTLKASACALIGCDDIGDTISGAQVLANGLRSAKQLLRQESICPASCALYAAARLRVRPN